MKMRIIAFVLCLTLLALMTACSSQSSKNKTTTEIPSTSGTTDLVSVTAITEVFGTGQKVVAAAVEYGVTIDGEKLSVTDFAVTDGTITKAYTNSEAAISENGADGNFVILEIKGTESSTMMESSDFGRGMQDTSQEPETPPEQGASAEQETLEEQNGGFHGENQSNGGPILGSAGDTGELSNHLAVFITQINDIYTKSGVVIAATGKTITSTINNNLIVDDFEQLIFTDAEYDNQELMYNLYVPENYDESKSYPLVLFMVDAGGVSTDPIKTLTQGLGAVVWASPEEQAKHECFVLAPQYTRVMVNDSSQTTEDMDITVDLIRYLSTQYSIDQDRIYNTGQSMGCMTSIAMDIKYPDLFAASFLVAGQWDAELVAPLADKPLWIVVCEGDPKAKPGMDAITEKLKTLGATVSKASWDSTVDTARFDEYVSDMLTANASINYTVFEGGSHTYTWQVAYTIEGIRNWLFVQSK